VTRALACCLVAAGCTSTTTTVESRPVPLGLAAGGLAGFASVDDGAPFRVLVDTGAPVTAFADGATTAARNVALRLYDTDVDAADGGVPRLELDNVQIFVTPVGSVGIDAETVALGGVIGGDQLSAFALGLDYRGGPRATFASGVIPCSCELAALCQAVLPFSVAGGQQTIQLGNDLFSYPASQVLVDGCLEPIVDPVSTDTACDLRLDGGTPPENRGYRQSGVEVKLLVATGFPKLAIGKLAFERLRGEAATQALGDARMLHLSDGSQQRVWTATLGGAGLTALALVSHEGYFGPCGELARSRRQRRASPLAKAQLALSEARRDLSVDDPRLDESCVVNSASMDPVALACDCTIDSHCDDQHVCDDDDSHGDSPTAAVLELVKPIEALIVDDIDPLLAGINADARPGSATVEGIIGSEVLARLVTTIDYPGGRFIGHCASSDGCLTWPRYRYQTTLDPSGCNTFYDPLCISPMEIPLGGGLCPAAALP
jgi:hypothetical protein